MTLAKDFRRKKNNTLNPKAWIKVTALKVVVQDRW
jgi:hypothetical protein